MASASPELQRGPETTERLITQQPDKAEQRRQAYAEYLKASSALNEIRIQEEQATAAALAKLQGTAEHLGISHVITSKTLQTGFEMSEDESKEVRLKRFLQDKGGKADIDWRNVEQVVETLGQEQEQEKGRTYDELLNNGQFEADYGEIFFSKLNEKRKDPGFRDIPEIGQHNLVFDELQWDAIKLYQKKYPHLNFDDDKGNTLGLFAFAEIKRRMANQTETQVRTYLQHKKEELKEKAPTTTITKTAKVMAPLELDVSDIVQKQTENEIDAAFENIQQQPPAVAETVTPSPSDRFKKLMDVTMAQRVQEAPAQALPTAEDIAKIANKGQEDQQQSKAA